jgi:hypothetical protein
MNIKGRVGVNMKTDNMNPNVDFTNDADVDEMLDEIMCALGKKIISEDSKPAVVNPIRVQQVLYTYKLLRYITQGTNTKVTYELYSPLKSMGSVTVVGKNIVCKHHNWFLKAIEFASNFEVYPKLDGTVEMNFTFNGLTKPIK